MAVWETEDEGEETTLPTSRTIRRQNSYRTPSRKGSKKSRRSPTPSKSPSPHPSTDGSERISRRQSKDPSTDDTISVLDPRRFTPTLHASLVSEILSLRRDQEEKLNIIESLEATLDTNRTEHEALQGASKEATKENRSLKRQLSLLEGGASSALGELARERDEAVDSVVEVKKKLDSAQKKLRTQEEDSQRVHDLWAQEKDEWEEERRRYEQRLHISETRLKTVLEEVTAYHAAQEALRNGLSDGEDSVVRDDAASVRTMSMTNSLRFSFNSSPKKLGKSLADELNFDPYDTETDHDGRESIMSGRHCRTFSRDSMLFKMHSRNMSIDSMKRPGSLGRGKLLAMNETLLEALEVTAPEDGVAPPASPPKSPTKVGFRRLYRDTGVQYSPPPSPKLPPKELPTPRAVVDEKALPEDAPCTSEIEANQRKKRVRISGPLTIQPPATYSGMVSAAAQTAEPLSPPKTPQSPFENELAALPQLAPVLAPKMVSVCTQTELLPAPPLRDSDRAAIVPALVPMIAIHAPTSRPASSGMSRLPPLFKDAGIQVSLPPPRSVDSGMQTDEILTEKRLALLPAHLQPSSINSRPVSPAAPRHPVGPPPMTAVSPEPVSPSDDGAYADLPSPPLPTLPEDVPPRNPRRLQNRATVTKLANRRTSVQSVQSVRSMQSAQSTQTQDVYPGNNDNGPLSDEHAPVRRPHRFSSLFAGFDGSSDEGEDFGGDAVETDNEFHTALSAPKPKSAQPSVSETIMMRPGPARVSRYVGPEPVGKTPVVNPRDMLTRKHSVRSDSKPMFERAPNKMRRSALIQSGIATHQNRPRSPSLPEAPQDPPPFPIPTRASSKIPPSSSAATDDAPVTPTVAPEGWMKRAGKYRTNSVRKVRNPRLRRRGSRSPPPLSPSTEAPESPSLAPPEQSGVATPRTDRTMTTNRDSVSGGARYYKTHRARASIGSATSIGEVSLPQQQAVGVVDAIAQTMVGEWMYKYVRKRKSFGVPDGTGKDDSGGERHKRWVWLAPYERSVLWSSKQPTSGGALLGKPGRKLNIQSVLDVKDDNAPPKGVTGLFNRSILILTPQRALKFTATSSERHYLWLTALSFLAHSSQAVTDMATLAVPIPEPQHEAPAPKRRGGIRDSIRLAKTKATAPRKGDATSPAVPAIPADLFAQAPVPDVPDIVIPLSPVSDNVSTNLSDMFPMSIRDNVSRNGSESAVDDDAADGPFIPRFGGTPFHGLHGRRRSNTGDTAPPVSFRGLPGRAQGPGSTWTGSDGSFRHREPADSIAGDLSIFTRGSSDIQASGMSGKQSWEAGDITGMFGTGPSISSRPSEASSRPSSRMLFEAIGTMRMEAFISPLAQREELGSLTADEMDNRVRRRSKELRRQKTRSRGRLSVEYSRGAAFNPFSNRKNANTNNNTNNHNDINLSYDMFGVPSGRGSATGMSTTTMSEEEYFSHQDPFKGF